MSADPLTAPAPPSLPLRGKPTAEELKTAVSVPIPAITVLPSVQPRGRKLKPDAVASDGKLIFFGKEPVAQSPAQVALTAR